MKFEPFELERIQSLNENWVDVNLSESGIDPMSLKELMSESELEELLSLPLGYGHTIGEPKLRERIASLYEGHTASNVLITSGSSEAIFLTATLLLSGEDELLMMTPNYLSMSGIAKSLGSKVSFIPLEEESDWSWNLDKLRNTVSQNTKLISLCNPNNPTGSVMKIEDMIEVARIANSVGAYIHSDEVYIGAEIGRPKTTSFQSLYENTIVTSGLSKSFAHPGIRIGWMAAKEKLIEDAWGIKDYTTISSSILSQYIACKVLEPETMKDIRVRTENLLIRNLEAFNNWVTPFSHFLSFIPPKAGGFVYVRYNIDVNSTNLVHNLMKNESVFVVPGDSFGMDGFFRIGLGSDTRTFMRGLDLITKGFHRMFPEIVLQPWGN